MKEEGKCGHFLTQLGSSLPLKALNIQEEWCLSEMFCCKTGAILRSTSVGATEHRCSHTQNLCS